ncbi:hypothetical protein LGN19_24180 [Burkholderia sp. AU30198]|uniref:hypothetical protein n=1 Tax=Burkholderia sp. AU30198 TaxID=2879627 RepID=UPI001CF402E5|nr:hypothetical protein [Burkholderia sp. AU30198]MCA8296895.1 hypothetical protein [Burkholderia sp. AU30198]
MEECVVLSPGPLIGIAGLCWAISYAKFPTGEKGGLKNIDCILSKRFLRHDPKNAAFSFSTSLSDTDRRELKRLWNLGHLPQLRYPMTKEEMSDFQVALSKKSKNKTWEAIFVDANEINRRKAEQIRIEDKHRTELLHEFSIGRIIFVDEDNVPIRDLSGTPLISREQAIAYLIRCGLVVRDEDDLLIDHGDVGNDESDAKDASRKWGSIAERNAAIVAYHRDMKRQFRDCTQRTIREFGLSDSLIRRIVRDYVPPSFPSASKRK